MVEEWSNSRHPRAQLAIVGADACEQCAGPALAEEREKAETGPVFNKTWFMIVGGLEYLS